MTIFTRNIKLHKRSEQIWKRDSIEILGVKLRRIEKLSNKAEEEIVS
jgi:hypothetical protein